MCTSFTVLAPAYIRLLGPGHFQISLENPAHAELGMPGPGPAIILHPVNHWCCDDPDVINIIFHTFDQKTAKSVKGYLCFLSKKFDTFKFFCPVHHFSPFNAWLWVVKSKKYFRCILWWLLLKNWGVKSFLSNFIFLL